MAFSKLFGLASGIEKLVAAYPAAAEPAGPGREHQTVVIGSVQYKRCTTVVAAPEGLYLRVASTFASHPAFLIPWAEVKRVKETRMYWQKALELTVGEPSLATVTILGDAMSDVRPHLAMG